MMPYFKQLLIWIVILTGYRAYAQLPDSIIVLKQVEIRASRILEKQSSTRSTQKIDTFTLKTYSTNSINELLSKSTNITINQYGASGLSSVSMRGGNANHTAVLWNGFNIQDPLNGEFNLALSTVNIIDEMSINYGGNSALYGSGAVGGSIELSNKALYNSGFKASISQSIGSFGKLSTMGKISYGNEKLFIRTRLFRSSIKNDFEYKNFAKNGFPMDTLKNSAIEQYGLLQEVNYKITKKQEISAQIWLQNNERELAPNMTVTNGYAKQYDKSYRMATTWNRKSQKLDLEVKNGAFYSQIQYISPDINLDVIHTSFNNITDAIANYKFTKKHSTLFGINNNYVQAESDNFNNIEKLNKTAFFLSYKFDLKNKILLTSNVRSETVNSDFKPLTYGLKFEYIILKKLSINTNISKNYRTPNFNDLYWIGAYAKGNPDLEDEEGMSADLGLNYEIAFDKLSINTNITGYYSQFNNLIHWQPQGNFWTPENKKLVKTKGIEFRLQSAYGITKNMSLFLNANYTYTDSKLKEKADNESDNVLNKQLIYIPYYQANGLLGFSYKKLRADIILKYVGQRYTTADNNNWLDKYITTDLNISYTYNYKDFGINGFIKINNIFNTEYMVREWYPTPLINYEIGLKFMYN